MALGIPKKGIKGMCGTLKPKKPISTTNISQRRCKCCISQGKVFWACSGRIQLVHAADVICNFGDSFHVTIVRPAFLPQN